MSLVLKTTGIIAFICLLMLLTRKQKVFSYQSIEEHGYDPYDYVLFLLIAFAGVLIIVEGFRFGFEDTGNYKGIYSSNIPANLSEIFNASLSSSLEPGFIFIQWCLRKISTEPQFFILFCAVVIVVSDVYFIRKHAINLPFSLLLYFLFSFIGSMNGLRQTLAVVLLMWGFRWVVEKKYIKYIVLILLASTIHRTALVVIPLLFIMGGKRWNKGLIVFVLFCFFSVVFPGPINFLIGRFAGEEYSHYLVSYLTGANILHVFIDGVPLVLGIIYHVKNRDTIGNNRPMDILINMQAISFGFMVLATSMAQYARIGMFMRNSTALVVPFLIENVFDGENKKVIKVTAIVLYFIVFITDAVILNNDGALKYLYLDFSMLG